MVAKAKGVHRAYNPGEDMAKHRDGVIVCQARGAVKGYLIPRQGICGRPVTKVGRYKIAGGWHDVYECDHIHRFGIRDGKVVDVGTSKPVFGEPSPF